MPKTTLVANVKKLFPKVFKDLKVFNREEYLCKRICEYINNATLQFVDFFGVKDIVPFTVECTHYINPNQNFNNVLNKSYCFQMSNEDFHQLGNMFLGNDDGYRYEMGFLFSTYFYNKNFKISLYPNKRDIRDIICKIPRRAFTIFYYRLLYTLIPFIYTDLARKYLELLELDPETHFIRFSKIYTYEEEVYKRYAQLGLGNRDPGVPEKVYEFAQKNSLHRFHPYLKLLFSDKLKDRNLINYLTGDSYNNAAHGMFACNHRKNGMIMFPFLNRLYLGDSTSMIAADANDYGAYSLPSFYKFTYEHADLVEDNEKYKDGHCIHFNDLIPFGYFCESTFIGNLFNFLFLTIINKDNNESISIGYNRNGLSPYILNNTNSFKAISSYTRKNIDDFVNPQLVNEYKENSNAITEMMNDINGNVKKVLEECNKELKRLMFQTLFSDEVKSYLKKASELPVTTVLLKFSDDKPYVTFDRLKKEIRRTNNKILVAPNFKDYSWMSQATYHTLSILFANAKKDDLELIDKELPSTSNLIRRSTARFIQEYDIYDVVEKYNHDEEFTTDFNKALKDMLSLDFFGVKAFPTSLDEIDMKNVVGYGHTRLETYLIQTQLQLPLLCKWFKTSSYYDYFKNFIESHQSYFDEIKALQIRNDELSKLFTQKKKDHFNNLQLNGKDVDLDLAIMEIQYYGDNKINLKRFHICTIGGV